MNKLSIKYRVSKKGNRIVSIIQLPCSENKIHHKFPGIKCGTLYGNIIKIKTIADRERLDQYVTMPVEDVFEIAVKSQNWNILPYKPHDTIVNLNEITIEYTEALDDD